MIKKNESLRESGTENSRYKNVGQKPVFEKIKNRLDDLVEYASQQITNKEIAELLGISEASFYKLMNESKEFKEAYQKGLNNRKFVLEKALFKRAEGFQVQEVQTTTDSEGKTTVRVTDKNYVPDTTALIFALKNTYPDKYKDKIETTTNINLNIKNIETLSNEELLKLTEGAEIEAEYSIE